MSEHGFKKKTIRNVLRAKINDWLSTIEDQDVKALLKDNVIVTGGSITSMLMGDEIKDFDVYFKTKEATIAAAEYYCKVFIQRNKSGVIPSVTVNQETGRVSIYVASYGVAQSDDASTSQEEVYENNLGEGRADKVSDDKVIDSSEIVPKYRPIFLSENAITLSDKIQLVIRFYGSPAEIHHNYDYEHCKNVYDHSKCEVILLPSALEAILSKTLLYTGSLYPICSLFRMRKFIDRGWRISAGEIVKMAFQISELDLKNLAVVKEQLTGCDAMYMRQLMAALISISDSEPDKTIDSMVIIELVDKVFNQ